MTLNEASKLAEKLISLKILAEIKHDGLRRQHNTENTGYSIGFNENEYNDYFVAQEVIDDLIMDNVVLEEDETDDIE